MMKTTLSLVILLNVVFAYTQQFPEGHILQYQQGFGGNQSLSDFSVSNAATWGIFNSGGNYYLQFAEAPVNLSAPDLPCNLAILNNRIFGDFVLEADVMPEAGTNGISEVCLFLGFKDKSKYYYVQLANRCDSSNHGIFVVKNSLTTRLTGPGEQPVTWNGNKWHKIRLERNIVKRTIAVYLDDMKHPVLQTKDYELVMGSVGFGSFTGPGRIDNIKIWAPTVISEE